VITLIITFFNVAAQEQLKHEGKVYKSADGRLYVNKKLPVYLWISTSPNGNADKKLLESESSKAYVNPFYFDTEGYNSIRTPSKVDTSTKKVIQPQQDIIWEVYADSYAPTSTISYRSAGVRKVDKRLYASNLAIRLTANDALSGVERILYSIDGVAFVDYKDSISLVDEKEYTVSFYSVDNVGNAEATNVQKIFIDKSAPSTELQIVGDASENVVSARSKLRFIATDKISGVKRTMVSIDNSPHFLYVGPFAVSNLKEGEHTVSFHSTDNLGNDEAMQTKIIFVDKTAPILIDELLGDSYFVNGREYTSGRSQLKLTAIDNKAGVKDIFYTVDGKNYQIYSSPFYLPNDGGNVIVNFYAVDKVNNRTAGSGSNSKFHAAFMDLKGPRLSHKFVGLSFRNRDTTFINPQTKIELFGSDDVSGMKKITYTVNNEKETDYSQPLTFDKEGVYTFSYRGYDNVNNSNFANLWFIVDKTGPEIFERYSIESIGKNVGLDVYPAHTVVFLSATDKDSGFDKLSYSLNDKPFIPYTGYINKLLKNTRYKVKVRAFDKLGNFKETSFEFMTGD